MGGSEDVIYDTVTVSPGKNLILGPKGIKGFVSIAICLYLLITIK